MLILPTFSRAAAEGRMVLTKKGRNFSGYGKFCASHAKGGPHRQSVKRLRTMYFRSRSFDRTQRRRQPDAKRFVG